MITKTKAVSKRSLRNGHKAKPSEVSGNDTRMVGARSRKKSETTPNLNDLVQAIVAALPPAGGISDDLQYCDQQVAQALMIGRDRRQDMVTYLRRASKLIENGNHPIAYGRDWMEALKAVSDENDA